MQEDNGSFEEFSSRNLAQHAASIRKKPLPKTPPISVSPLLGRDSADSLGDSMEAVPKGSEIESVTLSPIEQVRRHRQPLIDKLIALPKESAPFASALARIRKSMALLESSSDRYILILREELPNLVDPVDLFDDMRKREILQKAILNKQSADLGPLNAVIEHINNIRVNLKEIFSTLAKDLLLLQRVYEDFQDRLIKSTITDRPAIFTSKAVIVGDCFDFGNITNDLARKLSSIDEWGKSRKPNLFGNHSVDEFDGVFYKVNATMADGNSMIRPAMEFLAVSLLQLVAGDHVVAAPTAFVKIKHILKLNRNNGNDGYVETIIQAGLGVKGLSFHNLLYITSYAKKLTKLLAGEEREVFYDTLINGDTIVSDYLDLYPELKKYYDMPRPEMHSKYSEETRGGFAKDIVPLLKSVLTEGLVRNKIREFKIVACFYEDDLDEQLKSVEKWLNEHVETLKNLIKFMAVMSRLKFLFEYFDIVEIMKIIRLFISNLKIIYKKYNKQYIVSTVDQLLSYLDPDHFSATVIGHILLNPKDAKSDNFQARFIYNGSDEIDKIQIVGIDNDLALCEPIAKHSRGYFIQDACVLFFLDEMGWRVSAKVRERLISRSAMEWYLDWLKLIFDHSSCIREMIIQNSLVNTDLFGVSDDMKSGGNKKILRALIDLPVKLHPKVLFVIYQQFVRLIDFLRKNDSPTLFDIFISVHPLVAKCYQLVKAKWPSITDAYHKVHDGINLEAFLKESVDGEAKDKLLINMPTEFLKGIKDLEEIDLDEMGEILLRQAGAASDEVTNLMRALKFEKDRRNDEDAKKKKDEQPDASPLERMVYVHEAIREFFARFDWNSLSEIEQMLTLEKLSQYFPQLDVLSTISNKGNKLSILSLDWKKQRLQRAMFKAMPNAADLLIRSGTPVSITDEAGQTLFHMLLNRAHLNPSQRVQGTLERLVAESTFDVNRADSEGLFPLEMIADRFDEDNAIAALHLLLKAGAKINKVNPKTGQSALDISIIRKKPRLFLALLRMGAGWRVDIEHAFKFVSIFQQNEDYKVMMQEATDLLMQRNSEFSYRRTLSFMCDSDPGNKGLMIRGAECGPVYLKSKCVSQVLTEAGVFKDKEVGQKGRRKVHPITVAEQGADLKMHLKENPELAGRELAVGTLRRQLIGHGAPYTEVFRFESAMPRAQAYPVQFSKTVNGDNFQVVLEDPQRSEKVLNKLDRRALSEMIVTSILINPGDEQPANFIVESIMVFQSERFRLQCVDNDHGFIDTRTNDSQKSSSQQVESILFCLTDMLVPLDSGFINYFLELEAEQVIGEWLAVLAQKQGSYEALFTKEERKRLLNQGTLKGFISDLKDTRGGDLRKNIQDNLKQEKTPSGILITIPVEVVAVIYEKINAVKKAFRKNPYITGMQLLKRVAPEVGILYEEAFKLHHTPLARFRAVKQSIEFSRVVAARHGESFDSQLMLRSRVFFSTSKGESVDQAHLGPRQALSFLNLIHQQSRELEETLNDLMKGKFERFKQLCLVAHKEEVLCRIDWKSLCKNSKRQKDILELMCNEKLPLRRLVIRHCTELDKNILLTLLRSSPELVRIDLSYCPVVTNTTVSMLEKHTPSVQVVNFDGTLIVSFDCTSLPNLRRAMFRDCPKLERISITNNPLGGAHSSFSMLAIDRSDTLKNLCVNSAAFTTLTCDGIELAAKYIEHSKSIPDTLRAAVRKHLSNIYLEKAEKKFSPDNLVYVIGNCDKSIRYYDQNPRAFFLRGTAKNALKQYEEAEKDFTMAIGLRSDKDEYYSSRGRTRHMQALGPVTTLEKSSVRDELISSAISDLSKAIELNPTDIIALFYRGKCYISSGRDALAQSDFSRIASLEQYTDFHVSPVRSEQRVEMYNYLAENRIEAFDFHGARNWYCLITKFDVANAAAYQKIAECDLELENQASALVNIDKAIGLQPSTNSAYFVKARCLLALRDYDNYLQTMKFGASLCLNVDPFKVILECVKVSALINYLKGSLDEASSLIRNGPEHIPTLLEAKILHAQGEYMAALKVLSPLNSGDCRIPSYFRTRSAVYCSLDRYEEAWIDCEKALELDSKNIETRIMLTRILIFANRNDEASKQLDDLIGCLGSSEKQSSGDMLPELEYPLYLLQCYCYKVLVLFQDRRFDSTEISLSELKTFVGSIADTLKIPSLELMTSGEFKKIRSLSKFKDGAFDNQLLAFSLYWIVHLAQDSKSNTFADSMMKYGYINIVTELKYFKRRLITRQTIKSLNAVQEAISKKRAAPSVSETTTIDTNTPTLPSQRKPLRAPTKPAPKPGDPPRNSKSSQVKSTTQTQQEPLVLFSKAQRLIFNELPEIKDCVNLSLSCHTLWSSGLPHLFDRMLLQVCGAGRHNRLRYLSELIELNPALKSKNLNYRHLATILYRAQFLLDVLIKSDPNSAWKFAAICGAEGLVFELLGDSKYPEIDPVGTEILGCYSLGGQLECLKHALDRNETIDAVTFKVMLLMATVGIQNHIVTYLREDPRFECVRSVKISLSSVCPEYFTLIKTLVINVLITKEFIGILNDEKSEVFVVNELGLIIPNISVGPLLRLANDYYKVCFVDFKKSRDFHDEEEALLLAQSAARNRNPALVIDMVTNYNIDPKLLVYDILVGGDPDLFEYALDHPWFTLVDTFKEGLTVQHVLAREGHLNLLKRVLRDPNAVKSPPHFPDDQKPKAAYVLDDLRQSLLHLAAEGGQTEVFFYLYHQFFRCKYALNDTNFTDIGHTVAHSAARAGMMCFLRKLYDSRIYPELFQMKNYQDECLLFTAAHRLDANFLILIIEEFNLDVKRTDCRGNTVAHILASFAADNPSCWYVIEKLVERYPEHLLLDIPNEKGLTVRELILNAGGAAIFSEHLLESANLKL